MINLARIPQGPVSIIPREHYANDYRNYSRNSNLDILMECRPLLFSLLPF
jgi:hypothetical protein